IVMSQIMRIYWLQLSFLRVLLPVMFLNFCHYCLSKHKDLFYKYTRQLHHINWVISSGSLTVKGILLKYRQLDRANASGGNLFNVFAILGDRKINSRSQNIEKNIHSMGRY
ncbi:hypothetical protein L9F63_011432, partial [Diploptera punctata]